MYEPCIYIYMYIIYNKDGDENSNFHLINPLLIDYMKL